MLAASLARRDGLILAEEEEECLLKQNTNTWARIYMIYICLYI